MPSSAKQSSAIVLGGYGTFGRHVVGELAQRGFRVTVAGRDLRRARALAAELGPPHRACQVDANDPRSCRDALPGHAVAIQCAGPFGRLNDALLQAALEKRCHYVDIAEDRRYAARVRGFGERLLQAGLTAASGCSSLPAISTAAALLARQDASSAVERVRCTLMIGNDNPKGGGAVASAAALLGRDIEAPQGTLRGFRDCQVVDLPAPFARCRVRNFESPDYDLLPELLGASSVEVKVGFELSGAGALLGFFAAAAPRLGRWLLPRLAPLAGVLRVLGGSGGVVMAELFLADGSHRRGALVAHRQGQRMAALPAVYVAEQLAGELPTPRGAVTACDVLGAQGLVDRLVEDGYQWVLS